MWIWLLAITLTVGIWVAGHFLEAPLWLEVVPTVVIAAGLVAWIVGRRVRAALKARSLERELLRQAEQQAMNARPDRRAEILELHAQMQKGLQALRNSRRASRRGSGGGPGPSQQPAREPWGRRALYAPLVHDHRAAGRREDDRAQALGAGLSVPGPGRRGRRTRRRGHSQLRLVVHE